MILDFQNLLSDQQAITTQGNTLSTNTIDLGANGTAYNGATLASDPGKSEVGVFAQVTEDFASSGGTLQVQIVSADNAALSTNLTVLQESAVIPSATLKKGYKFRLGARLPPGITQRFLGLRYVVGTAAMTAGKVTAGLALDVDTRSVG